MGAGADAQLAEPAEEASEPSAAAFAPPPRRAEVAVAPMQLGTATAAAADRQEGVGAKEDPASTTAGALESEAATGGSEAGGPMPQDDASLLLALGKAALPTWDRSRFRSRAVLQKCPRNKGEVLLVEDLTTGRRYAAKKMPVDWVCMDAAEFTSLHPGETEVPWMDMGATRWLNLRDFKHCVEYFGVFLDGEYILFVMGFAEGGDLFAFMDSMEPGGPEKGLESERALKPVIAEFFDAVRQLHGLGLAHRDLSLENVLLTSRHGGPVRIIDFGMATTQRLHSGPACGKPSYIAPEVHRGKGYDAFQADAFSCGVILYVLIVRDYPWMSTRPGGCKCFEYVRQHGLRAFLSKRRVPLGQDRVPVITVLSDHLVSLLTGLLSMDPDQRLELGGNSGDRSVWGQPWLQEVDLKQT
mmetsp:Transcript_52622/g.112542  ORF Transcript_52622/g.112542 Transcript_52622/m.112542 type:complete len:413 (-) Transcript_52622:99-1337(-)